MSGIDGCTGEEFVHSLTEFVSLVGGVWAVYEMETSDERKDLFSTGESETGVQNVHGTVV